MHTQQIVYRKSKLLPSHTVYTGHILRLPGLNPNIDTNWLYYSDSILFFSTVRTMHENHAQSFDSIRRTQSSGWPFLSIQLIEAHTNLTKFQLENSTHSGYVYQMFTHVFRTQTQICCCCSSVWQMARSYKNLPCILLIKYITRLDCVSISFLFSVARVCVLRVCVRATFDAQH